MIIRSLCRRPAVFQSFAAAPARSGAAPFIRKIHTRPTLANEAELEKNGIPGLLSPRAFRVAWTEYQQHMMDELNASTSGSILENQDPKNIVLELARDPTSAYAFNVASMAWNNHQFFKGISTNPNVKSAPSSALSTELTHYFSSLSTLRETFLATAEAMFGPGFVWLVQQNENQHPFRILTTYIAGTPLSGAHYRRQSEDLNSHNPDSYQAMNKVGHFGRAAAPDTKPKKALGGVDIIPLLCVNTWEHVWLTDYGVRGKRDYLEAWWDKINWDEVAQYATLAPRNTGTNHFQYR
ncbi:Fe superoxide dismutase-like protein [Lindgomyces ingoldianus]|uniref:Fe superoxide dismutase-like protein n=1 Tax=Lindgomyces ingoldianus TaxID=673940 RepID=A0ACB6R7L6_9PLEO|nr:Fe superoxide dismutase-like protein [Lindgomyces ingoldianus]KAF2474730.1 Fe superoxide dismutase-like protein [Lindgomyces ingoldianus]